MLLFYIIIFNGLILNAQEREISGRVTNSSKEPVTGVSVVLKGTAKGTATEKNGQFSIRALPEDTVLTVSLVGMKTQEINIKNKK
jgi:P pilus assembly chaperone PapD